MRRSWNLPLTGDSDRRRHELGLFTVRRSIVYLKFAGSAPAWECPSG